MGGCDGSYWEIPDSKISSSKKKLARSPPLHLDRFLEESNRVQRLFSCDRLQRQSILVARWFQSQKFRVPPTVTEECFLLFALERLPTETFLLLLWETAFGWTVYTAQIHEARTWHRQKDSLFQILQIQFYQGLAAVSSVVSRERENRDIRQVPWRIVKYKIILHQEKRYLHCLLTLASCGGDRKKRKRGTE